MEDVPECITQERNENNILITEDWIL